MLENDLNRVFNQSLGPVAAAEFEGVAGAQLPADQRPVDLVVVPLGRATGLSFTSTADRDRLRALAGRLSSVSILFVEQPPGGGDAGNPADTGNPADAGNPANRASAAGTALSPLPLNEPLHYGTDLVSVQRYRGKTNERLTRAMLNLALANAGIDLSDPRLRNPAGAGPGTPTVLDPMCGRGTTLNWALCYGLNAIGIEPDLSSLRHYDGFLTTWAKRHRLPHKRRSFRANNAEHRHLTLEVAPTRAEQKAGAIQRVETFNADGGDRSLPIKRGSIDVIVADLPYGVQHRADPRPGNDLDPSDTVDLVSRLAPTWRRWLRRSGSVCLAWNVKRASRAKLSVALAEAGLVERLPAADGAHSMRHVVDSTITRDVIVAVAE